jgi:hypothetical protein
MEIHPYTTITHSLQPKKKNDSWTFIVDQPIISAHAYNICGGKKLPIYRF